MSYSDIYLRPPRAVGARYPRTLSLRDHILQAYLPYFTANHFCNESDVEFVLDGWLRSHPDLRDSSLNSPVSERTFRKAFYLVIQCMVDAEECGDPPPGAGRRLIAFLEDLWVDDMRLGPGRGADRANRLFRALAEVSNAAASGSIGSVLRSFFLGWLYEIAEEEDTISLAGWCSGIMRSCMDPRDKQDCLRAIASLRPNVLSELHGRGLDWLSLQSMDTPTRKWPRRRRADGRQWWDRENDKRIRRLIEDQEYLDRAAERNRRNLDLHLPDLAYDLWPRSIGRSRSSGSLDRALQPATKLLITYCDTLPSDAMDPAGAYHDNSNADMQDIGNHYGEVGQIGQGPYFNIPNLDPSLNNLLDHEMANGHLGGANGISLSQAYGDDVSSEALTPSDSKSAARRGSRC
ncbi:hypothetical protein MBLNU13_g03832t1 [Cladosporium sp. NU13]